MEEKSTKFRTNSINGRTRTRGSAESAIRILLVSCIDAQASRLAIIYWYALVTACINAANSDVDVCGFFFRKEAPYTPNEELADFLNSGPTPIYIGFGSIVLENPEQTTDIIMKSVRACGVRAIVSKGWSNLGTGRSDSNVLFLGDCPHGKYIDYKTSILANLGVEWLSKHVSAVIHHGGAGTTACGLLNGRPTGIVPFFGE